ncbi:MAG TPA: cytochrome D1, partial [Anaeromyxobacteraceae bacterium]|nr:cytochrome D1 [Anaeromyxobacteraceae bacterium]
SGTVSVIDVERLRKVKQLKTGPLPIAAAASPLSQAIYVADGKDGQISVVDGSSLTVRKRIAARPGLGPMRFGPDGRWGFVVNPVEQAVHVVDAAEDRLAHTVPVPGQPYQVGFTRAFAYLRLLDSERVAMLSLSALAGGQAPAVQGFAAGSKPPKLARDLSLADAVAQAATEAAVFVASPADGAVYYYMEGMNAPSGSYGGYGHGVRAAAIADRSLREVEPGVYAGTVRLPEAGRYQVPFLLESPRILHCFAFEAGPNPLLGKAGPAVLAEYPGLPLKVSPGGLALRVRLQDPGSLAPITAIPDVRVSYFRAPGEARTEVPAGEVGDGLYEARLPLEKPGTYYLYLAIPSRKLKYGDLAYRTLVVSGATAPAAGR